MQDVTPGQVWEIHSGGNGRWVRAIVTKIDGDQVTLRYEGLLEFLTVPVSELQGNSEMFRPTDPVPPP
jgi:hypothetical protein